MLYPKSPVSQSINNIGNAVTGTSTSSSFAGAGASGTQCQPQTAQVIRTVASHVSGDSSLSGATSTIFMPGTGSNGGSALVPLGGADQPGSLTDGTAVTSSNSYSLQQGLITYATATGAYPLWYALGTSATVSGQTVYSTSCTPSSSNSAQWYWSQSETPIQAPGSGTSSTTNVGALVTSSTGALLQTAATTMPSSSIRWDTFLQIKQNYKAIVSPVTVYGTTQKSVTNFGTIGSPSASAATQSGTISVGLYEVISCNCTDLYVGLDAAAGTLAPGAQITSVGSNKIASGTTAWVIGPIPGCNTASGSASTSTYNCVDVPIDIYQTDAPGSGHLDVFFQWADNQQGGYIVQYLTTPAKTSYPAATAGSSGVVSGLTILTSTSGGNAGNPAALVEQYYATIQASN